MTKKILLIDDNETVRDRLYQVLTRVGYNVKTSNNGLDGFHKIQSETYDLCIADHFMPLINGIQLLKNIDSMGEKAPRAVMFLTTQPVEIVSNNPVLGVADVIMSKPIAIDDFINNVTDLIEQTAEVA